MDPLIACLALFCRVLGNSVTAGVGALLDYAAYRIGRFWLVALATWAVRDGRHVFLLALLLDCLAPVHGTTFVFTLAVALSQFAHSIVFTDINQQVDEKYYFLHVDTKLHVSSFVFFSTLFHYPQWTGTMIRQVVKQIPVWLWTHATFFGLLRLAWQAPLFLLMASLLANRILHDCQHLFNAWIEPACRFAGKAVYDLRLIIAAKIDGQALLALEPEDSRLPHLEQREYFTHNPLGARSQIRLLHILPRGNSETVRCAMVHADLDTQTPVFEAMSYTWNSAERSHVIFIDGRPFRTTKNAHDLLLGQSPMYLPRPVWIDSICINQDDLEEKSWHVQTMARIYRRASRVIVWLGTAPNARLAVDLILELNHSHAHNDWNDDLLYNRYLPQRGSARWLALGDLFEHSYFTRVWMVQEVAVNRNVHVAYGGYLLLWKTVTTVAISLLLFHKFSTFIEDTESRDRMRAGVLRGTQMIILNMVRNDVQEGHVPTLQDVLMDCWTLLATDPRDKVFALRDIVTDPDDPLIAPDYRKPVHQVFADVAQYLVLRGPQSLRILSCAGIGWDREVQPLASWVPDWSSVDRSVLASFPQGVRGYEAAGSLTDPYLIVCTGDILEMNAIILQGSVVGLGSEFVRPFNLRGPSTIGNTVLPNLTHQWMREARQLISRWLGGNNGKCKHTNQGYEEVVWRVALADAGTKEFGRGKKPYCRPAPQSCGSHYRHYMKKVLGHEVGGSEERGYDEKTLRGLDEDEKDWLMSLCVTTAQHRCMSRRLAFTSDNFLCLAPPQSMPGDMVAIIPGLSIPVLVRRVAGPSAAAATLAAFQLVGECYVHGIMDGERADPARLQRIAIV